MSETDDAIDPSVRTFSCNVKALIKAVALVNGSAVVSQTVLFFNGPLPQSGKPRPSSCATAEPANAKAEVMKKAAITINEKCLMPESTYRSEQEVFIYSVCSDVDLLPLSLRLSKQCF